MKHNRILAAVAALVLAFAPSISLATEWKDGEIPVNGAAPYSQPVGGFDGTSHRAWRVDSNGIGRMTEEYPITSQRVSFAAAAGVAVTTGLKAIGNGYGISPYGRRLLRLTAARTGSVSSRMVVYLYSSDDNVTYKPLLVPMISTGVSTGWAAFQDTAMVDTVMFRIPMGTSGVNHDAWYMIPSEINLGRYVQLWAFRDSALNTTAATLSATWELREQ